MLGLIVILNSKILKKNSGNFHSKIENNEKNFQDITFQFINQYENIFIQTQDFIIPRKY
jgi:hypothetical protein